MFPIFELRFFVALEALLLQEAACTAAKLYMVSDSSSFSHLKPDNFTRLRPGSEMEEKSTLETKDH